MPAAAGMLIVVLACSCVSVQAWRRQRRSGFTGGAAEGAREKASAQGEYYCCLLLCACCKEQRGRMKWRSKVEVLNQRRRDRWCDELLLLMTGSKSTRY